MAQNAALNLIVIWSILNYCGCVLQSNVSGKPLIFSLSVTRTTWFFFVQRKDATVLCGKIETVENTWRKIYPEYCRKYVSRRKSLTIKIWLHSALLCFSHFSLELCSSIWFSEYNRKNKTNFWTESSLKWFIFLAFKESFLFPMKKICCFFFLIVKFRLSLCGPEVVIWSVFFSFARISR